MNKNNYSITDDGFIDLWGLFQTKNYEKLKATQASPLPQGMIWTSTLTEANYISKYISPEDYIIHIWTLKTDPHIKDLLDRGFKLIFSNYDELYLDCG